MTLGKTLSETRILRGLIRERIPYEKNSIFRYKRRKRRFGALLVSTQVGFAEFNNTADNRANIGGTIIGAPIVGQ